MGRRIATIALAEEVATNHSGDDDAKRI